MVQAGVGGLDTPRTNVGDATYLTNRQLDFELSPEASFQSPSKDSNNLLQHLKNGRRGGAIDLKTPRGRGVLGDKRNVPLGGEFTPMLKSNTRNSTRRMGKENILRTPGLGVLENIAESMSPLPQLDSSVYGQSRNGSYLSGTPMPRVETSSVASTPMALLPRRKEGPGVLQDGNQMSLREQENVIDKIEKENFGLKLKIHFLEEALRKAGPGFSEAALRENTELKVDKVTMQKELHRYKKTLASAERDVDIYRQQLVDLQEKMKRKHADAGQQEELDRLRQGLHDKENELERLRGQENEFEDLQDKLHDLEADLREKDRFIDDREDEVETLRDEVNRKVATISDLEDSLKKAQRREVELEEQAQSNDELKIATMKIEQLEADLESLEQETEDAKDDRQEALRNKERAEADLEELQDELANKSITTKGLSRQVEEKANRLQDDLEDLRDKYSSLEEKHADKIREVKKLLDDMDNLKQDSEVREQKLKDKLEMSEDDKQNFNRDHTSLVDKLDATKKELQNIEDEKNLLQIRHDALTSESIGLQRDLSKSQKLIADLEDKLDHEKTLALTNERDVRDQYKIEIDRLSDEIEDLQAEAREKQQLYDQDSDNFDSERRSLETQRDSAEEKATRLQRTIDMLQQAEGNLSSNEKKLQQALESEKERHENQATILNRQISDLHDELQARRATLEEVRTELTAAREELRLSQREQRSIAEKVEALEDEVEVLQTSLDDETDRSNEEISAAKQDAENLRRQLQSAMQDLARAEAASADARAQTTAFQGDIQADRSTKDQLSARLREVESQLSKVREEKQSLKEQLTALTVEIHASRSSKADAEAERDELQSQLRALKQHDDGTFRLDQERIDLRTTKMKLDGEIRRLKEENKLAAAGQRALESELQEEIDRASAEEARLNSDIQDLQKILRGSSEKKELAAAKKTIQHLESRILELESQISAGDNHTDTAGELSMIRRDLSTARSKETEYLQREAAQKDLLRGLKRQITELERKAHDAEISRLVIPSPQSSYNGSARKSELAELRHQLSVAHETLKDVRSQLKTAEKNAAYKLNAAISDLEVKTGAWEIEKDELESALDEALLKRDQLAVHNNTAEATISRLRVKIERLEQALQAERLNTGEDRTIAMERHDLHEMLRESHVQVESLELTVQQRESAISTINAAAENLSKTINRVREERDKHKSKAEIAKSQLKELEVRFHEASEAWESEKKLKKHDHSAQRLREERDLHRVKAEAAGKRLIELELKIKEFSSLKSSADKMSLNLGRIRKERDDLRAHVERSHVRIAMLEEDIKKAVAGWEAEKHLSKDVERLRQERDELLSAQISYEEQLHQHESQVKNKKVSSTTTVTETEIKRIREERDRIRTQAETTTQQLEVLEHTFHEATQMWDSEKLIMTRGARLADMSVSFNDDEVQLLSHIETLKEDWADKESYHMRCMRGLQMQIDWWKAKCDREAMFRDMGTYAKRYMKLQIETFEACNKADLSLLRSIPGMPSARLSKPKKMLTMRKVGLMVRAIVRMKKGAEEWAKSLKIKQALEAKHAEMARASRLLEEQESVEKKEARRLAEEREMKMKVAKKVEGIKRKASLRKPSTAVRKPGEKRKSSVAY